MLGLIQTETPYYQANPPAPKPFTTLAKWNDPDYSHCPQGSVTCPMAWGLRIVNSESVFVYGAGLYNFFQNYGQGCIAQEHCRDNMVSVENSTKNIYLFNINTKTSDNMVSVDGQSRVRQADNRRDFCSTIAEFVRGTYGPIGSQTLTLKSKIEALLDSNGKFVERMKPMYTDVAMEDFVSVKSEGAKGDSRTDDTQAIARAISKWAGCKVIYFPAGDYVVTDTIEVPGGSRVFGKLKPK
ncbi:unnamed protein product, partial [Medioppia subpectinata]